jgi:UDP-N-acetylglucosamine--N-acetylmuramyl-(pentapeptide) pyrophosphoryl-undecaprenol N-acetylglucosamine transferase
VNEGEDKVHKMQGAGAIFKLEGQGLMESRKRNEDRKSDDLRVMIAGGGTGGHLFPGVAVGKEVLNRYPGSEILFVTAGREMEAKILAEAGFQRATIAVEGIKGRGWPEALKAIMKLPYGLGQAVNIIARFSPDLVLGVGGYSAGPVCLAARLMGVPVAVHEQNSFPGLTNRLLSRVAHMVFISFEESRDYFPARRVFLTGNPIRENFLEKDEGKGKETTAFTILVTGGSQGARAINKAFLGALEIMKHKGRNPEVIHQTGEKDIDWVKEEYHRRGLRGDIMPFIKDMRQAYLRADIFLGRAGAGTIFELAAMGKPSILIPYPYAANNHQETNARVLAGVGGAKVLLQEDLTPERLAGLLTGYMDDEGALRKMGERVRTAAKPEAAKAIVDHLEGMLSGS